MSIIRVVLELCEINPKLQAVDQEIPGEENRKARLELFFVSLPHHLMTAKGRATKEFIDRFEERKKESNHE